jgi:diaminohydroxyphosphoribosylaminopyrimidine deaminase/5-amino-6-(5-phosphoribosylamino)uracil reductase
LPGTLRLFTDEHSAKTILLTNRAAFEGNTEKRKLLEERGISIIALDGESEWIDLKMALSLLGARGIASVLVESGPILASSLIKENLFDEMVIFYAPIFLGSDAMTSIGPLDVSSISGTSRLALNRLERVAGTDDILVHLRPAP